MPRVKRAPKEALCGLRTPVRFIITAGPTREYLDPVRFLSNPSTGKMGFAIAAEAARRGHEVTLVAGPVTLKTPDRVHRVDVTSARDMLAAVREAVVGRAVPARRGAPGYPPSEASSEGGAMRGGRALPSRIVLISTAAVADWRPAKCATKKLKKGEMSSTLKLVRNPDILKTINRTIEQSNNRAIRLIGFAAETNDVLKEAARKCREKGLEFIVANDVTKKGSGFGADTNRVTFVFPDGTQKKFPLMTKRMVAKRILDEVSRL